jgi:hypothetical protein
MAPTSTKESISPNIHDNFDWFISLFSSQFSSGNFERKFPSLADRYRSENWKLARGQFSRNRNCEASFPVSCYR